MLEITFYTFTKNSNSTKRPGAATPSRSWNIRLLEPTSVTAPKIALVEEGNASFNPTVYNYAYLPDFGRYYFVNDWIFMGGRWVASMAVDALASWKDIIGNSMQYVVRSATDYNGNVVDTYYPTENSPDIVETLRTETEEFGVNPFTDIITEGCYVVGIINGDNSAVGCVSYYVFNNSQFKTLCSALMGNPSWVTGGVGELGDEFTKIFFNPFQYIVSCRWFPVSSFPTSGGVSSLPYGWWSIDGVSASRLSGNGVRAVAASFKIPKHPQKSRGTYLNGAPYSRHRLDWTCIGSIPLDANRIANSTVINVQCFIDPISGGGVVTLFDSDSTIISTHHTKIGVDIQISQISFNYAGIASGVLEATTSLFSGGVSGVFGGISNAVESAKPQMQTSGTNGMISAYRQPPVLISEFYSIANEDREHRGRPLMEVRKINTLNGFLQCSQTELELPSTSTEIDICKSYMDGGFYFE